MTDYSELDDLPYHDNDWVSIPVARYNELLQLELKDKQKRAKALATTKQWQKDNREKVREYQRRYAQENYELQQAARARYLQRLADEGEL